MRPKLVATGTLGPKLGEGLRIPIAFIASSWAAEIDDEMEALIRVPVHRRGDEWRVRWRRATRMNQLRQALEHHCSPDEGQQ